jgi:hypothetical protein
MSSHLARSEFSVLTGQHAAEAAESKSDAKKVLISYSKDLS